MDEPKPFACKIDGCGMSFTNEDHLTVHTKKHDMILNLGGDKQSNIFVADQTPTPTRLIRNCEEVGLFEDLQHVNPFDETFRRAVESKSTNGGSNNHESVSLLGDIGLLTGDDTLHTPHVFPHYSLTDHVEKSATLSGNDNSAVKQIQSNEEKRNSRKLLLHDNIKEKISAHDNNLNISTESEAAVTKAVTLTETPCSIQTPLTSTIILIQPPVDVPKIVIPTKYPENKLKPQNTVIESAQKHIKILPKESVKIQPKYIIKYVENRNMKTPLDQPEQLPNFRGISHQNNNLLTGVKQSLKTAILNGNILSTIKTPSLTPCSPNSIVPIKTNAKLSNTLNRKANHKKNKSLPNSEKVKNIERNNAAAKRYRNKMKTVQLTLWQRNKELETENLRLKNENDQLRGFLLAHQNCSVTKAQGYNIVVVPPEIIVKNEN